MFDKDGMPETRANDYSDYPNDTFISDRAQEVVDDGLEAKIADLIAIEHFDSWTPPSEATGTAQRIVELCLRTLQSRIEPSDENVARFKTATGIDDYVWADSVVRDLLTAIKDSQ